MTGLRVSTAWVLWAHGPYTECTDAPQKYPSSWALVAKAESERSRGRRSIVVSDETLIRELLSVAECYGRGSATDDMGPWWIGYQRKVVRGCRGILR